MPQAANLLTPYHTLQKIYDLSCAHMWCTYYFTRPLYSPFFCMHQKACVIASSFYCVFLGVHVDTGMQQPTLVLDKKVVEPRFCETLDGGRPAVFA